MLLNISFRNTFLYPVVATLFLLFCNRQSAYLNHSGPAGGYICHIASYFRLTSRCSKRILFARLSLVLYISLRTPWRHRQGLQPVSRCCILSPDRLHCRWSRSGVENYFSTLPAIVLHCFLGLAVRVRHPSSGASIGQSIRHVCWKLALAVGDSVRYCYCEYNRLLLLRTWPWQLTGQTARRHYNKPTFFYFPFS
jgi:hypothetical protein